MPLRADAMGTDSLDPSLLERAVPVLLRPYSPPLAWGVGVAAFLIAVEVLIVELLAQIAPDSAFGAVFLFGVLVVSAGWDFRLALATSVASAVAYAWVHVNEDGATLVPAVLVFTVLALLTNLLVGQSRLRAAESDQRRREADLLADLARTMLREVDSPRMFDAAGAQLSQVLDLAPPGVLLGDPGLVPGASQRRVTLRDGDDAVGALLVPAELSRTDNRRIRRVVPALEALLVAARDRQELHERTVELARQQESLRKVATLVASRADFTDICSATTLELARGLGAEQVSLLQYHDDSCMVLAVSGRRTGVSPILPGEQLPLGGNNLSTLVKESGEALDLDYEQASGIIADRMREGGLPFGSAVPVAVEGRTWGALVVGSSDGLGGRELRARLTDFADLVATAVFNMEARTQLTASRARVIAAADQARRTIERDLHDGAQQRIVALGLDLRAAADAVPDGQPALVERIERTVETLSLVHADLQELSRGIHPAILSRGGLGAALKNLARRSTVPTELAVSIAERLPEEIEVAAYYVVAESLTNAAKHADATGVRVTAGVVGDSLELKVADDGVGGAGTSSGSGLLGLRDRTEAVGGALTITSPPGAGTEISVTIPLGTGYS
ncbi:sensor histidine kinase [Agromyces sp. SYSU T00194]|uniref:sensor histidine kinase n=1 Tax=Agromyces chitinivorans TaxID=3158560 RepID=UPI00339987FE